MTSRYSSKPSTTRAASPSPGRTTSSRTSWSSPPPAGKALSPSRRARSTSGTTAPRRTVAGWPPTACSCARGRRTVSRTTSTGTPNCWPPAVTTMTLVTAMLSGRRRSTVVPAPGSLLERHAAAQPHDRWCGRRPSRRRALRGPTPSRAVEKPGRNSSSRAARSSSVSASCSEISPFAYAAWRTARGVDAAPVVAQLDHDTVGLLDRRERDRPLGRLAGRHALLRALQPVVETVAHQVHERIGELLEHVLVGGRLLAASSPGGPACRACGRCRAPAAGSGRRRPRPGACACPWPPPAAPR